MEDDLDRIARFRRIVALNHPDARIDISRTAPEFIARWGHHESTPDLICLDHDLFPDNPEDPDPGDGRDVSDFLQTHPPTVPY